jgi:ribonuclease/clavin/mitogillin
MYFRYKNTNCFFIESAVPNKIMAVDAGWPCSLYEYARNMKKIGLELKQIAWTIVTHFHMDHTGLIGEFQALGINCIVFENQASSIDEMERIIRKNENDYPDYKAIQKEKLISVKADQSKEYFESLGIKGEVIVTTGHSMDSITYITDKDEALIGDLYPLNLVMENDTDTIASWELIRKKGVKHAYPSHANPFDL